MATVVEFREALRQMRSSADGVKAFGERVAGYRVQAIVVGYQIANDLLMQIDNKALKLSDMCVAYAHSKERSAQVKYKEAFLEQLLDIEPDVPKHGAVGQMARNVMLGIAELVALAPKTLEIIDGKIDIGKRAEDSNTPILFSSNALIKNATERYREAVPKSTPNPLQRTERVPSGGWQAAIDAFHSKIAGVTLADVPKSAREDLRELYISMMIMFNEDQQKPPAKLRLVNK
jgi:hypothetical protein